MKYIKVILVLLVIAGLVISYVFYGFRTKRIQAPTTLPTEETPEVDFKGPTEPPNITGPTSSPPTE